MAYRLPRIPLLQKAIAQVVKGWCKGGADPSFLLERCDRLAVMFPPPVDIPEQKVELRRTRGSSNRCLEFGFCLASLVNRIIRLAEHLMSEGRIGVAL